MRIVALWASAVLAFGTAHAQGVDFTASFAVEQPGSTDQHAIYEYGTASFVALPSAPGASLAYTVIGNNLGPPCLSTFSLSVPIDDLNVTFNGTTVMTNGIGTMTMGGMGPVGSNCSIFFSNGGAFSGTSGGKGVSIACNCDENVPGWQSALTAAKPLSAFLQGAEFNYGGEYTSCFGPGFSASGDHGQCLQTVAQVTSVPEPPTLALFGLGLLGIALARRPPRIRLT